MISPRGSGWNPPDLSAATRNRVDWQRITDTVGVLGGVRGAAKGKPASPDLTEEDRVRLRQALKVVRDEFARTLSWLKVLIRVAAIGSIVAIVIAVGGGVLLQISPWAGVISIGGVGTLLGLLFKIYQLARDQVMLEILPARYELALEFCRTQADAHDLIARFLAETSSFGKTTAVTEKARAAPAAPAGAE